MAHTKARILHVDDHQDTRLIMAALLQDRGYGCVNRRKSGGSLGVGEGYFL
jgi:CheY-like chemotaxis protein